MKTFRPPRSRAGGSEPTDDPAFSQGGAGAGERRWRRGRSRGGRLGLAICLIAVGAGAATLVINRDHRVAAAKPVPLGTATVRLGDLIETQRYTGTLSYPSRGSVSLSGPGTVTSLPHAGQILTQGGPVAAVDDRPIGVLFGTTSLYRTLRSANPTGAQLAVQVAQANLLAARASLSQTTASSPAGHAGSPAHAASVVQARVNVEEASDRLLGAQHALRAALTPQQGPDVALVAHDMRALGYYAGSSGGSWSVGLEDAVRQWQEHLGATPSGAINPADVLVLSGGARVSGVQGELGGTPAAVTLSLSSLSRVATFKLADGAPPALVPGRRVVLSAAGDRAVGRVISVKAADQSATVAVAFSQSSRLARIGSSQVAMTVTLADRPNVLTVPTQALLALASGGYALQLPDGTLVAVHTGIVQHGDIEVSGAGVHSGLRVVSVV